VPVREKAEVDVLPLLAGKLHESMGHTLGAYALSEEQFWDVCDFVNELYVAVIEAVDFNRVILEAGAMCGEKQAADKDHLPAARQRHYGLHRDDSMFGEGEGMQMEFCADCFRLCALRMEKHRVMEQEDVETTLPDEHARPGWRLPDKLAVELADWVKRRREAYGSEA
jgi:hypothetical protein